MCMGSLAGMGLRQEGGQEVQLEGCSVPAELNSQAAHTCCRALAEAQGWGRPSGPEVGVILGGLGGRGGLFVGPSACTQRPLPESRSTAGCCCHDGAAFSVAAA